MTPSFLCVHPSVELYGADRTFLQSVEALKRRWPDARITVLLTGEGVLTDAMREIVDDVRVDDLFILRRREVGPRFILRIPHLLMRIRKVRRLMAGYDVVYVNTVVILDLLLSSRLRKKPVIVHVHELPTGFTRRVFSTLLRIANAGLIFISEATRKGYDGLEGKRAVVVWNGTRPKPEMPREGGRGTFNILLIGRFNAWKGQPLLLDAIALLSAEERARVHVRLVGSAYKGQEYFKTAIEEKVAAIGLADTVEMLDFDPNPDRYYGWADVVAVPSAEPEPFGLVAIEGMAAGRAVIASRHGGLEEIVVDGETGTLFTPRDPVSLRDAIRTYLAAPDLAREQGEKGRTRFAEHFDEAIYMRRIADVAQAVAQGVPIPAALS